MENRCESNLHDKLNEMLETVMHRGSPFQRKEVLRTLAKEVATLPLDEYDVFMEELFLHMGIKYGTYAPQNEGETLEEAIVSVESELEDELVGSDYVDSVTEE